MYTKLGGMVFPSINVQAHDHFNMGKLVGINYTSIKNIANTWSSKMYVYANGMGVTLPG